MPLLNTWWNFSKHYRNVVGFVRNVFKVKRRIKMAKYEYLVLKLGSSAQKNEDVLNRRATEDWELVGTASVSKIGQNAQLINDIQAFLRREVPEKSSEPNTIIG